MNSRCRGFAASATRALGVLVLLQLFCPAHCSRQQLQTWPSDQDQSIEAKVARLAISHGTELVRKAALLMLLFARCASRRMPSRAQASVVVGVLPMWEYRRSRPPAATDHTPARRMASRLGRSAPPACAA